MSNKKRINDRMVMLQKRSARIERNMMIKVLLRLGINSTECSKAILSLSNTLVQASKDIVERIRGISEEGSERIVCADGSVKAQKIGVISGGTYGSNALDLIRPGTELFMIRKDSTSTKINNKHESYLDVMGLIPKIPNVIFDETTELDRGKLQKVTSITENLNKASFDIMDAMRIKSRNMDSLIPKNKSRL